MNGFYIYYTIQNVFKIVEYIMNKIRNLCFVTTSSMYIVEAISKVKDDDNGMNVYTDTNLDRY